MSAPLDTLSAIAIVEKRTPVVISKTITERLYVLLWSLGNPDFGQDPEHFYSEPGIAEVFSLREASACCRAYIDHHNLGGGNWSGGQVFNSNREWIAQVSYNGRVWEAGEYPQPEIIVYPEKHKTIDKSCDYPLCPTCEPELREKTRGKRHANDPQSKIH